MANTKFDKLLGLLEPLETDSVGEWIIDKEHKGTEDDPIYFPYPMYTEMVNELIEAVYEFEHENPEYELTKYGELLKVYGIPWGEYEEDDMDMDDVFLSKLGEIMDEKN